MWSDFTQNNLNKLQKIEKIHVDKDSYIIKKAKNDRNNIINLPNIKYNIKETKIPYETIEEYCNSPWVYDEVLNTLNTITNEYLIEWDNNKIYIKCTFKKFEEIKKRLNIFLKIITYIKGNNELDILIYLILTPLKKYITNDKKIDAENINSGYTHIVDNYIFIWREEEFEKVTFHELIHLFKHDHRHHNFDNFEHEAITDFKAVYYNLIYISILTRRKIVTLFNLELTFMFNQAKMINNLVNNNIKLISPADKYFILKYKIFKYYMSNPLDDINEINYIKLLDELDDFTETVHTNFYSSRMTFFELI